MSDPQWISVGAVLGSALAAFGSAYSTLTARSAKKSADDTPSKKSLDDLASKLALLEQRLDQIDKRLDDGRDRMGRIESRLERTCTDEEVRTSNSAMQAKVEALTEKVGRLTGVMEQVDRNLSDLNRRGR